MGNSPPRRAMADLPDDILAELLGRLSPRDQASSRCVCKAWRGVIDARRLLRADLLPLTLRGIFLMDDDYVFPPLFSRPSTAGVPAIGDDLGDCIAAAYNKMNMTSHLHGHCNGLLLFTRLVVNPATGGWARFPRPPMPPRLPLLGDYLDFIPDHDAFLAFDPTVSPYYEVFSIPEVTTRQSLNPEAEWPPSPFVLRVFSSRTGQWEERLFQRERHGLPTMGTVADIREHEKRVFNDQIGRYSVFYRGRLYVQCQNDFLMRINTSSGMYHLLKQPMPGDKNAEFYLGKSKDGVYYATVDYECRLQVWYLDESHSQLKWVLKCDTYLKSGLPPRTRYRERDNNGPWSLQCYGDDNDTDVEEMEFLEEIAAPELEWSSDMEEDIPSEYEPHRHQYLKLLGFHPYKEIVFLHQSSERGIAYHLNCSKIQDLGSLDYLGGTGRIEMSFSYTPCWSGNL